MALAGIGVDMLEIARMQQAIERRPHFIRRMFTDAERVVSALLVLRSTMLLALRQEKPCSKP